MNSSTNNHDRRGSRFFGSSKDTRNAEIRVKGISLLLLAGILASSLLLSFPLNFALAATASSSPTSSMTTTSTTTTANQDINRDAFQLAVTPIAPKLPADGKDYFVMVQLQTAKDGKPREAPYDIDVTLLTSDETVASLQDKVTIKTGESLAKAVLTSTSKAGKIEITAVSQGIASGSASLETINLGSLQPTKLAVYSGASSFIPNPSLPGKMYVQLLNSGDIPAITNSPLTVYLSSGDPKVGSVPKYVIIPAGTTGIGFDFIPTTQGGMADITASANGLLPAKASIKAAGPVATKLVIEFAPSTIPAPIGYYSDFTIQLRDDSNFPVLAKQQTTISLVSSDTKVATVPIYLTIEQGSSYALGQIKSNGKIGTTTISASAQGLASGAAVVTTTEHNEASEDSPKKITVYSIPSSIVPNNNEKAEIIVQVTDIDGKVYSHNRYYLYNSIILSTSNPRIGSFTSTNLVGEMHYSKTMFKSSFNSGESTISALSDGYDSGQTTISTKGSSPFSLATTQIPKVVLANGHPTGSLIVSLFDEDGRPTVAQQDILISLSSSNPEIASVEPTEFIVAGESYGQVELHTTTKAGKTTITAQGPGLAPSSIEFKTVGNTGDSSQYTLGLDTVPKLPADGRTYNAVFVQLQDSNGNPVPAESDVHVILSSSANTVTTAQEVTINKGSSYAVAALTTSTSPAKVKITASSIGFGTVTTNLETTLQPLRIASSSQLPAKGQFESMLVAADVFSGRFPIANATVKVSGIAANTTTGLTNADGHVESMLYIPTVPGKNSIMFTVTKPGYEQATASYTILLEQTVTIGVDAKTEGGQPVPLQAKVAGPSGTKTLDIKTNSQSALVDVKWGTYKISVPAEVNTANARFKFTGWSDGVAENSRTTDVIRDSTFTAKYSAEYLLTVTSEKGMVSGGGYYKEGKTAVISISPTTAGNLLVSSSFHGWTGDVRSESQPTTSIVMNGPKTIKAEWADSYIIVLVMIGAAGAGGFILYHKMIKPRMVAKAKSRAPDLDWYKS
jgi:hypothetical protein